MNFLERKRIYILFGDEYEYKPACPSVLSQNLSQISQPQYPLSFCPIPKFISNYVFPDELRVSECQKISQSRVSEN
jgi:hypothetical protein